MKKAISVLMFIVLIFTVFSGCVTQTEEKYPLTVNSTPIDGEIFRYYLDYVWNSEETGKTKDGRITEATHMCIRYVAVNSTFRSYGLSLSDSEKADISQEANALWNLFGAHYEKIGVSKQTFIKIKTSEAYIEKLRVAFFDAGGTDEISDSVLRGVLSDNFIAFRYVRTPVYNTDVYGNKTDFSEDELNELNKLYNEAIGTVATSYNVEKAYDKISAVYPLTEMSYETVVSDRNDHKFSSVFFDAVKNIEESKATIFIYEGYVYLVYRINILSDVTIFYDKRSECLKIISEEPLQSKINIMCNSYHSQRDTILVNDYYEQVANNR